MKMISSESV